MKYIYLLVLIIVISSCKKEPESPYADYVCVYGKSKTTLQREYIGCRHREIVLAGNNQRAADEISEDYGIPKVNVLVMNNFTQWESIPDKNCDCQ